LATSVIQNKKKPIPKENFHNPDFFKFRYMYTLTAGQKELGKTLHHQNSRSYELTTNSQGTLAPASSQSSHFDDKVEAYIASKDDKPKRKLERNMFISQLTLYDENQQR
jgi:hypothetical protein